MSMKHFFWALTLGGALVATGCAPILNDGYGGGYGAPYYGTPYGAYDPYDNRGYDPYDGSRGYGYGDNDDYRSPEERRRHRERKHDKAHDKLERKQDKALNRLGRQEQEAEAKLHRKYGGNTNNPEYQRERARIGQRYNHKREKVDRHLDKKHRDAHRDWR